MFQSRHFLCFNEDILVFQSRNFVCSNQDISRVPINTMFVFQSRWFVCSNQGISSFPKRTIRHLSISSYHQITYMKVHFVQKSQKKTLILLLPLHQKSHRPENDFIGGHFSRRSCQSCSNQRSSSKITTFDFIRTFSSKNFIQKIFSGVEKWNVGNHLKRVFPKFEADRSHPRGVNDRSKFRENSTPNFFPKNFAPPKFSRRRKFFATSERASERTDERLIQ